MNSLRPLATISLLGIVGLFLYMKINETEPVVPADVAEWGNLDQLSNLEIGASGDFANIEIGGPISESATGTTAAPYGMPAEAASVPAIESAPPFNAATSPEVSTAFDAAAAEPATEQAFAPPVDDRYATAAPPAIASTGQTSTVVDKDPSLPPLPAIPVAAGAITAHSEFGSNNSFASAPTTPSDELPAASAPAATSSTALAPHVSTPTGSIANATQYPSEDPVAPTEVAAPSESSETDKPAAGQASLFSATRVAVQSALDRGELSQALLLLSDWYGDPSLAREDAAEVQELLSQLAGSVIYSTEHRLEPPYMVQAGETLEEIAQKHNVPWQLLAKINGIASPDQLQPGQQLKVVRGPFSARIDLSDRSMVLMLDRRYAGQFPLEIEPTTSVEEGYWSVNQKLLTPGSVGMIGSASDPPSEERSILLTSTGSSGQVTVLRGPGVATPGTSTPVERVIKFRGTDVEDVYDILSVGSQVIIRR